MILSIINLRKHKISLAALTFVVEASVLIIGLIWAFIRRIPVFERIRITPTALTIGAIVAGVLLLSNAIFYLIDQFAFESRVRKLMEEQIFPLFKDITFPEIIFLSLMSGFCEEFFFRGVLMPEIGIIGASVFFGMLHTPGYKTWFLGLWTALVGVVLSIIYIVTGNLFIPMVAHALNNFIAITYLRYFYPHLPEDEEKETKTVGEEKKAEERETEESIPVCRIEAIQSEALQLAEERVKSELEEAKKSVEEIILEAKEVVQDLAEEFLPLDKIREVPPPESEEDSHMAASPVQLLDPSMVKGVEEDSQKESPGEKISVKLPEPDYEALPDVGIEESDLSSVRKSVSAVMALATDIIKKGKEMVTPPDKKESPSEKLDQARKALEDKIMNFKKENGKDTDKGKKKKESDKISRDADPGISIPPDRRAPDIDDEGIGVIHDPQ